jgi:hypothetical protein
MQIKEKMTTYELVKLNQEHMNTYQTMSLSDTLEKQIL